MGKIIWRFIRNFVILPFIGVIVLLIFLWFLCIPKGQLVLAVSQGIESYKSKISEHFQTAVARTQNVLEYHGKLSFKLDPSMVNSPLPGQRLEQAIQSRSFSDFVKLGFKFEFGKKPLIFSGEFNLTKIAQFLYDKLGYCDYYLVITNYEEVLSRPRKRSLTEETAAIPEMLAKLIVCLHPFDITGKEIPGRDPGPEDQLQDELAFYIYECFWPSISKKFGKDISENLVPINELSRNLESLKYTSSGFEILKQGVSHGECVNVNVEECVQVARGKFEAALNADPENAHANFGLGIVSLRQAVDAKEKGASAFNIGKLLVDAGHYIHTARTRNTFIRKLTESHDWRTVLRQWPEYRELKVTNNFIDTIHNYRSALEGFAKADYAKALDLVQKVKDIPPDFNGLLKSFEYEAKLYVARTKPEVRSLLKGFKKWSEENPSDPGWEQSYAFHACRHKIDTEDALRSLDRAIDNAGDLTSQYVSYALKAQCLAIIDRHREARKVALKLIDDLSKKPEAKEYMGLYLDLGYLFAMLRDYQSACEYFVKASKFWQGYMENVRNAPDLEDFRTNGQTAFRRFNKIMLEYYHEEDAKSKQ